MYGINSKGRSFNIPTQFGDGDDHCKESKHTAILEPCSSYPGLHMKDTNDPAGIGPWGTTLPLVGTLACRQFSEKSDTKVVK